MNSKKVYYFEQPKLPGCMNVAVCPFIATDGRLTFEVPASGVWGLTGQLIEDGEDSFVFQCDDEVMRTRGGTYHFHVLDLETLKTSARRWISHADDIIRVCKDTTALHTWYRENYPPTHLQETE